MSQAQPEQAIELLLRRFVPKPERAFAALIERGSAGTTCAFSRGLSEESAQSLLLSEAEHAIVQQARMLTLEGASIDDSSLVAGLTQADRAKIRTLHLIAVGEPSQPIGVFATTALYPTGASAGRQASLAKRLVAGVTARLRGERALREREAELRLTSEMLDLRAVADQRYGNPVGLIEAFLAALAPKVAADAAALFLFARDGSTPGPAVARFGGPEVPGVSARWKQYEETLARFAVAVDRPRAIDAKELPRYGIESLMGSVLLLPLRRDDQVIGVTVLSRGKPIPLTPMEQSLATWAAEFLAHAIPRVLSQAVFERQARQDGLTGLANRREWDRCYSAAFDEAFRTGAPVSILLCDLDRFKVLNDTFGHRAGDETLRIVARTFQDQVFRTRASDPALIARYGGEELAVLLPGFEAAGAFRIAEAIRQAVQETVVSTDGNELRATVSIGLATFPAHADSAEVLVARADMALYEAKMTGRNRVCSAGPLDRPAPAERPSSRRTVRHDPSLFK
ncbi:MAG: GGDEF domain-containing protein [Planctomycetaceae bacterium]|nr:GGDEF domain-containing protein [Planctomycetaceae bacterium]